MKDLIVLAEFDELTGPRPLRCWPRQGQRKPSSPKAADQPPPPSEGTSERPGSRGQPDVDAPVTPTPLSSNPANPATGGPTAPPTSTSGSAAPASSASGLPTLPSEPPAPPPGGGGGGGGGGASSFVSQIDLDQFILRIMTVDLHSVASMGQQSRFRVTEDSQVVLEHTLSEPSRTVYAFVHHFVLHDLSARGFVRPFCLAYITQDEDKLLKYYGPLSQDFTKTCRLFKYGNQANFTRDLRQRESDLMHTLNILSNVPLPDSVVPSSGSGSGEASLAEREATAACQAATTAAATAAGATASAAAAAASAESAQSSRQSIHQALDDIRIVKREIAIRIWDEEFKQKWNRLLHQPYKPGVADINTRDRSHTSHTAHNSPVRPLKSNTDPETDTGNTSEPVPAVERVRRKGRSRANSLTDVGAGGDKGALRQLYSPYTPKYATVLKHKMFNTELKDLEALCGNAHGVAIKRVTGTLKRFGLQHNELLLNAEESRAVDHPSSLVLTIGRCLLLSFQLPVTSKAQRVGVTSNAERHGHRRTLRPQRISPSALSTASTNNRLASTLVDDYDDRSRAQSMGATSMVSMYSAQSCTDTGCDTGSVAGSVYVDATEELREELSSISRTKFNHGSTTSLNSFDSLQPFAALSPIPPLSPAYDSSLRVKRRQKLQNSAEHVALDSRYKPGFGILRLKQHCSFLPHLIYPLVRGRPVVVIANPENEAEVRSLITTLWLFVPGHSENEKVIRWRDARPLQLSELTQIKLIGMSKRIPHGLPKAVERCVTVVDFEAELLVSPEYTGTLVNRLMPSTRELADERMLLANIHAEFLDWASTAFLYFHMFCLGSGNSEASAPCCAPDSGGVVWANEKRALQAAFLAEHGIDHCDVHIITYLAEVVKRQQITEFTKVRGQSCGGPPIRMEFAKCHKFGNTKGPMAPAPC